jgi:hypothetical protein
LSKLEFLRLARGLDPEILSFSEEERDRIYEKFCEKCSTLDLSQKISYDDFVLIRTLINPNFANLEPLKRTRLYAGYKGPSGFVRSEKNNPIFNVIGKFLKKFANNMGEVFEDPQYELDPVKTVAEHEKDGVFKYQTRHYLNTSYQPSDDSTVSREELHNSNLFAEMQDNLLEWEDEEKEKERENKSHRRY